MSAQVKWLHAGMTGAPQMDSTHGQLISVLDAALKDGFNPRVISGITRVGSVATATTTTAHGFLLGQSVTNAGANQSEYNGEKVVTGITTFTYTFDVTGTPTTPATAAGAMGVKTSPLGWDKPFATTNRGAYRSPNVLSNRHYLYVDNSASASWSAGRGIDARVYSCENMTDIDTRINPVPRDGTNPTDGHYHWYQARGIGTKTSTSHGAYNRHWVIVGDDRAFYLLTDPYQGTGRALWAFGDFISYKPNDLFSTMLLATENYDDTVNSSQAPAGFSAGSFHNSDSRLEGSAVQRGFAGVGAQERFTLSGIFVPFINAFGTSGNNTYSSFPNQADGSAVLSPRLIYEWNRGQTSATIRGQLAGCYATLNSQAFTDLEVVDSVSGFPGRKFLVVAADAFNSASPVNVAPQVNAARWFFDISGPWFA